MLFNKISKRVQYIADYYFQFCVEGIFAVNFVARSLIMKNIGLAFITSLTLWLLVNLLVYIWYRISFKEQRRDGINRCYLLVFFWTTVLTIIFEI